jgi:hypothetical protein
MASPQSIVFFGRDKPQLFFRSERRSIAFSAAVTASDLIAAWPLITTPATDAVHFQTPRSMPWTTVYSMSRYFILSGAFALLKTAPGFRSTALRAMWASLIGCSMPPRHDHVPGIAGAGSQARRCATGGGQQPALVAQQRHAPQRRVDPEMVGPTGAAPPLLTSTSRTARCGPACRVVWQGCDPQGRSLCRLMGSEKIALRFSTLLSRETCDARGRSRSIARDAVAKTLIRASVQPPEIKRTGYICDFGRILRHCGSPANEMGA